MMMVVVENRVMMVMIGACAGSRDAEREQTGNGSSQDHRRLFHGTLPSDEAIKDLRVQITGGTDALAQPI